MQHREILTRWRSALDPFSVGMRRALVETVIGYGVLVGIGIVAGPAGYLASLLLVLWPAWRLRPVSARSMPARLATGLARLVLVGIVLSVILAIGQIGSGTRDIGTLVGVIPIIFALLGVRLAFRIAVALGRRLRRRLRWQLMASHLAVIVLTFITLTGVGSVIAASLLLFSMRPNAPLIASSVAKALASMPGVRHTSSLDRTGVQTALDLIESEQVILPGMPPIGALIPSRFVLLPTQIVVLSTDGRMLAAAGHSPCASPGGRPVAPQLPPKSTLQQLATAALAGRTPSLSLSAAGCEVPGNGAQQLSAAAIRPDGAKRPSGVVVVEMPARSSLTPRQVFGGTLAFFSVATIILLTLWLTPSLALSGTFGYLLARGLTRRLESVSRVTTAIAAGDFTQRAPVNSQNEVGHLAENVNRMAAHLETAMGDLLRARTQAENALRDRQELVASISHELRTPLAIVRAHLDTLQMRHAESAGTTDEWEPDVTVPLSTLRALQHETERLASLVDDLFALSRAQTGVLDVRSEPVDVAALVADVAALMRPLAQSEGMIALAVEAPPGLPAALADGDRLRQILSNLVRNAVRHTPDGGIIVLTVYAEDRWVVISVADTGEGIPPEDLPHIFERFYRVDQARTRSSGGAGLGLAIVREFVELMGGHVTVESTLGEGSCFRVYLPRATTAAGQTLPPQVAART